MTDPRESLQITAWERIIQTQMHFNDLSVRSRQLGLTFVVAAMGLAVVTIVEFGEAFVAPFGVHVSTFIVGAAAIAVLAVWTLDLGVYHRMLRGAVSYGEAFERAGFAENSLMLPQGMTEYVSIYSRFESVTKNKDGRVEGAGRRVGAADKVRLFYWCILSALLIIMLTTAVAIRPENATVRLETSAIDELIVQGASP